MEILNSLIYSISFLIILAQFLDVYEMIMYKLSIVYLVPSTHLTLSLYLHMSTLKTILFSSTECIILLPNQT